MQIRRRDVFKLLGLAAAVGLFIPMKDKLLTNTKLKLGLQPAASDVCRLQLKDYFDHADLPAPPENFGHETLVSNWGMLGNGSAPDNPASAPDGVGDCAIAGPYHAIQLWNKEAGRDVRVSTQTVLNSYSTVTGYDPKKYDPLTDSNPTDHGSNVDDVAAYWATNGFLDDDGNAHKISAYLALEPGDLDQLWQALYLFDGLGVGFSLPTQWQTAFQLGQVWDVPKSPQVEGGHYVLGVGRRGGHLNVVTWGRTQLVTPEAYQKFNTETLVYFSEEKLLNGKDIDGFDRDSLIADLKELAKESKTPLSYIESDRWVDDGGECEAAA